MSTCLHRFTPDTNLVQPKIRAVETCPKLFLGKSQTFTVIDEPSYLGLSEEICRTFQPPPLTYHAYYAPLNPFQTLKHNNKICTIELPGIQYSYR
jgi:hypothetical protein